eukprot:4993156-Pleurochrysis_carterae.AAC.1
MLVLGQSQRLETFAWSVSRAITITFARVAVGRASLAAWLAVYAPVHFLHGSSLHVGVQPVFYSLSPNARGPGPLYHSNLCIS